MLLVNSHRDVQHGYFDEVHDLSHWGLLLLSYFVAQIVAGNDELWLHLMTATWDTPVAKAILDFLRTHLPHYPSQNIRVAPPSDRQDAAQRTTELPDSKLPPAFANASWEQQTIMCIERMRSCAQTRHESSVTLVLVPGEKEMHRLKVLWLSSPHNSESRWDVFLVSSETPKGERRRIRKGLESQRCQSGYNNVLVLATSVFESSITLYVNGVIDTGLAVAIDFNGFLRLGPCNVAQTTQRKGRAGRVTRCVWKAVQGSDPHTPSHLPYRMPKDQQLSVVFSAVCTSQRPAV